MIGITTEGVERMSPAARSAFLRWVRGLDVALDQAHEVVVRGAEPGAEQPWAVEVYKKSGGKHPRRMHVSTVLTNEFPPESTWRYFTNGGSR